jgi:hypothetical protein
MLMHRAAIGVRRAVAARVWWASGFQGEAAGRSMAVPVNWRSHGCIASSLLAWGLGELGACWGDDAVAASGQTRQTCGRAPQLQRRGAHCGILRRHCTIGTTSCRGHWGFFFLYDCYPVEHVTCAMLIPPLARAAHRPGLRATSLSLRLSPYCATRVLTSSPLHRKHVHGQRPTPGSRLAVQETKAAKPATSPTKAAVATTDPLLQEQNLSNKEQRKADWAIMKEMSQYLWPKDNMGTRARVGLSVALLVGAKLLNVQVPFYFKNIVDSMNIDFVAVGGTAWTVAGSMVMACKLQQSMLFHPTMTETCTRWPHPHGRNHLPRTSERCICQRGTESYTQGGMQRVRAPA